MNILYLYNHRMFMGAENTVSIIGALAEIDGINFSMYGPYFSGVESIHNDVMEPLKYSPKITAKDLYRTFKPDLILLSFKEELDYWIPSDLDELSVPKIIIEADYQMHLEADEWYKRNVDLMIMMSYFEKTAIQSTWWPFSARGDIVDNIDLTKERKDKVFFQGSLGVDWYSIRKNAVNSLCDKNLMYYNQKRVSVSQYLEEMSQYKGMLTCSSIYHTPLAKMFEGMLTKTAVLTNWFKGSENLFGKHKPYFEYKDNCEDIVTVANELLNDDDKRNEIINVAHKIISENHTGQHRVKELYSIITNFVTNGYIIRKWGH